MTTWVPQENELGLQSITETSTVQKHPLGKIIRAYDADGTYGSAEFIYLEGIGSTVVGSLVSYSPWEAGVTALSANTANQTHPLAVAMSANVASQFGWYQIAGAAVIKKTAIKVNPGVALYQSGTTGRVTSSAASAKQVQACRSINAATVASATSTITAVINRSAFGGVL